MKVVIKESRFTPLPYDYYLVRVNRIDKVEWEGVGPSLEWEFEVIRGKYAGCLLRAKCNLHNSLGPRQKFGRWYFALTRIRCNVGDSIDTDTLTSKTCWAQVVLRMSKSGKPSNAVELVTENPNEAISDTV